MLAGFGYAVFLLLTRLIETDIPPIVSVYQTGLVGCVASTAAVGTVWQQPAIADWPILIAIGAVAALAHLLIIKAFEKADASTLAPFTYAEVIGAALLGYIVFGDAPDMIACVGLGIIVASAIIVAHYSKATEAEAPA